jgi:hypothetical protein
MRVTHVALLLFVLCSASSCTLEPLDNTTFGSSLPLEAIDFIGFGSLPNQTVVIQGFDKRMNGGEGGWVPLAIVQTASVVGLVWAETNWYRYEAQDVNVNNPVVAGEETCIFGTWIVTTSTCVINPGSVTGRFRVRADNINFLSFEEGFLSCIGNEIEAGRSQAQATINCQGEHSPELHLRLIT